MSNLTGLKLEDVWFPEEFLNAFDGPSYTLKEMREYLGVFDRPILGTIVKPKIGLKPAEFADVCYEFWMGGGDFVKFDEPQADQSFCPFIEVIDEVGLRMEKVRKETGRNKVLSVNISAADFDTMLERAEYVRSKMERGSYAFLVDGIIAGWTAVQTIRRHFSDVFLHFHRAGHGAFTRPENPFGFSVPVMTKFGRLSGASGMHTGTVGIGKMKGNENEDILAADAGCKKISVGKFFKQDWGKIKPCCPIASGGLKPEELPELMSVFGYVDFITTMGGGCHSYPGGTREGARALIRASDASKRG